MEFIPFTSPHWAGIALTVAASIAIIVWRAALRRPQANRAVRAALAAALIGSDAAFHLSYAAAGAWGVQTLPLQLCSMTLWLSVILMMTRSRKLCDVTFFLGVLGALQATLTPNLDETFPHIRYFQFFVAHAAIIAANVFMLAVERYRPTLRSVVRALVWLHVLAVPAAVTNALADTNFMFLAGKPLTPSLLDLLAPWPWYLLQLELVAAAMCLLLLGAVKLAERLLGGVGGGAPN